MLDKIVADTRDRLPRLAARADEIRAAAAARPPARDFEGALAAHGLSVIAEIKRASPSRGVLNADLDPEVRAQAYERGGAAAISVLTEPNHFLGSEADLRAVRVAVQIPVLRKDFTIDELQIWEARAMGADAVLLIVAVLTPGELGRFLDVAAEAGVAALVEAHSEPEAEIALRSGARIIGINNRDLTTFDVDLATAEKIAPMLADVPVTVAESGIFRREDAARMQAAGYDALLVGESLVRAEDPAAGIAELTQG
jgi:indole-3-glycerol phosphate synthase